jgi:hypothetical protein
MTNPDSTPTPVQQALSPEEIKQRQAKVKRWVILRGLLLGLILGAWWILFAPDELVAGTLKYVLGVAVGVVATGSYLYNLRATLFPKAAE